MLKQVLKLMISGQYNMCAQLLKGLNTSQQLVRKLVEVSVRYQLINNIYNYDAFDDTYYIAIGNCYFTYDTHYDNARYIGIPNNETHEPVLALTYSVINEKPFDAVFATNESIKKWRCSHKKKRVLVRDSRNSGIYRKIVCGIANAIIKEYHIC